ncbi:hypothetical protein WAF17_16165 [Bernardetia sp. ABR2-2B]
MSQKIADNQAYISTLEKVITSQQKIIERFADLLEDSVKDND